MDEDKVKELIESAKPRWKYTNDVAAILITISLVLISAYGVYQGQVPSLHYAYVLTVLASSGWLFGVELVDKYLNGDSSK